MSTNKKIKASSQNNIKIDSNFKLENFSFVFICIVTFITYLVYRKVTLFEITNYDDDQTILFNPYISDLSFEGIKKMFLGYNLGMYSPFGILFYAILYSINGADPVIFHSASLMLHLLNILLVYIFLKVLLKDKMYAIALSSIFALHPLNCEVVSWISANTTALYSSFYLLALIFYLKHKNTSNYLSYFYIFLFFIVSILIKSSAITFTLIIILIDYFFYKVDKKTLYEKVPFLITTLIFGFLTIISRENGDSGIKIVSEYYTLFERFLMICHSILFYFFKFIIPTQLCFHYPFPNSGDFNLIYYISPILLISSVLLIIKFFKSQRLLLFGLLFYLSSICIMLPYTSVGNYELRFDRYNYLGIIGMSIFFIEILKTYYKKNSSKLILFFVLLLSLIYGYLSQSRAEDWKNSDSIWSDGIKKHPTHYLSYYNKGVVEERISGNETALTYYKKSLLYNPYYYPSYVNMGSIYFKRNDFATAFEQYKNAVTIDSTLKEFSNSMAICALKLNHLDTADNICNKIISKYPEYIEPYVIKATVLNKRNKSNEALIITSKAEKINPFNYGILFQKAFALTNISQYRKAIDVYNIAESIDTSDAYLFFNKAILYNYLQKQDSACIDMKKAYFKGVKEAEMYIKDCL